MATYYCSMRLCKFKIKQYMNYLNKLSHEVKQIMYKLDKNFSLQILSNLTCLYFCCCSKS